eukprot:9804777-Alexandrium_andersonii.AAC.1
MGAKAVQSTSYGGGRRWRISGGPEGGPLGGGGGGGSSRGADSTGTQRGQGCTRGYRPWGQRGPQTAHHREDPPHGHRAPAAVPSRAHWHNGHTEPTRS